MNKYLIVFIIGLLGVAGIIYFYSQSKSLPSAPVPEVEMAKVDPQNTIYTIEGRQIKIVNGEGSSGGAATSEDYYDAVLEKINQTGDIDDDGTPENLVVISYNSGGTGVFSYLGLVKASLKSMPTIFIGDRVIIQTISVEQGIITVNYLDRKEDEAMAAMPTVPKVLKAKFSNNQLINLNGQ